MAKPEFYTREKEIGGIKYVAQFNGLSSALSALDECTLASGQLSVQKLTNYILSHVIVEPKGLSADDFEDIEGLNEVVKFGREVMQGMFRPGKE